MTEGKPASDLRHDATFFGRSEELYLNGNLPLEIDEERSDWGAVKKRLSGLGSVKLQALLFEGISRAPKPYLVFFDSLDRISPTQQAFVETILNISVVCASVVQ